MLPGGRGVLFITARERGGNGRQVAVLDSKTGQHKALIQTEAKPVPVEGGYLLYWRPGATLHAVQVRFGETRNGRRSGSRGLRRRVDGGGRRGSGFPAFRGLGTLVYVPGGHGRPCDRSGVGRPAREGRRQSRHQRASTTSPRLSPDGTRVALTTRDQENDIYVWDLRAGGSYKTDLRAQRGSTRTRCGRLTVTESVYTFG